MSAAMQGEPFWDDESSGDEGFTADGDPPADEAFRAGRDRADEAFRADRALPADEGAPAGGRIPADDDSTGRPFSPDRGLDDRSLDVDRFGDRWSERTEPGDRTPAIPGSPAATPGVTLADVLRDAAGSSATPDTMAALARLDPGAAPALTLVHAILACQRLASWADAVQQSFIAALARPGVAIPIERVIDASRWSNARPGDLSTSDRALNSARDPITDPACAPVIQLQAARFASMELGTALHLSPLTARLRVDRALCLVDGLPRTLAAQRAGEVDSLRARMLIDATTVLTPTVREAVERCALARAGTSTPSQLRAALARTILRLDPDGAADRAKAARKNRDVYSRPEADELAMVSALMTADKAATMMWLLNSMADAAGGDGDGRTIGERRVDALTDIVDDLVTTGVADVRPIGGVRRSTDGDGGDPGASADGAPPPDHRPSEMTGSRPGQPRLEGQPRRCDRYRQQDSPNHRSAPGTYLTVYLTVGTLAGLEDLPAELAGHGPISPGLARELAGRATAVRTVPIRPDPPPPRELTDLHRLPPRRDVADSNDPPPPHDLTDSSGAPSRGELCPPVLDAGGLAADDPTADRDDARCGHPVGDRSSCDHPGCAAGLTCGGPLDRGQASYRPPQVVVDYVVARDERCRFPGCRMPATRCDLDHQVPFGAGGSTCPCNLRPLCRAHHLAKTFTGWTSTARPDGSLAWTSPLGLHHTDPPDNPVARLFGSAGDGPADSGGTTLAGHTAREPRKRIATSADDPPF